MTVGLHVSLSAETLDRRLTERDDASWDYFSESERDLEDEALRTRRDRYYSQAASLMRCASHHALS